MLAFIFKDILTLTLINGYYIMHTIIMIVKLTDILDRFEEPTVKVIEYNHSQSDIDSMWTGCLTARKALAEVYGTVPMYLTHNPIFPQVQSTPDLYFREEIKNLKLHHDEMKPHTCKIGIMNTLCGMED